ncbi:MAG: SAM-dependent methyltransferase [Pseudonocardiaceae bacterium]
MDRSGPLDSEIPPGIDTSVPHSARVWNYWLQGKDNYPVDREAAERYRATRPDIVDVARATRGFLMRTVRQLTRESGIRQFLDIGTGLPTANNTHEIAQAIAPECRIVYVDNDPLVLVHARALLTSSPEGMTDYLDADVRDPGAILAEAARTLDFSRPIALILLGIMEHVLDIDRPHEIVRQLLATLPTGSHLVLADPTTEVVGAAVLESMRRWNESGGHPPIVARSRTEITRFFDGLELLEPGVVSISQWRPDPADVGAPVRVNTFGGVGRKP